MYIIIVGTLQCGFTFYGPFLSYEEATTWGLAFGLHDSHWELIPLETPPKVD